MKNILRNTCLLGTITLAALLVTANSYAQVSGQWDFDSGNLNATVGSPLTYADAATQSGTTFGSTTSFGIPDIGGSPANVMKFPANINGMGYKMPNPLAANGGGSQVNEWTILMDVLYPASSDLSFRPIIDTDYDAPGAIAGPEAAVSAANSIGLPPSGPFFGTVAANTWYRLGISVTASTIAFYINGEQVGTIAGAGDDGRAALTASGNALILGNTLTAAALGYVNSIQLRSVALNPGQMLALGAPSASGIPQTIPPVPSFVQNRTPAAGATGVAPQPTITVVLNAGDTTGLSAIQLKLDGANLTTSVTPAHPLYTATATTSVLDPDSDHTLTVTWTEGVSTPRSSSWSFRVQAYQKLTLPPAFYLETFDTVSEATFPQDWYATNNTQTDVAGFDLANPESDAYKDWIVITTNTLSIAKGGDPLLVPPIMVNGSFLTAMANNQLCYAESDSRGGSQVQMLFVTNINCLNRSNVFLSFHSIYEQNQDNINGLEYSVDGGANWLPLMYMVDDENQAADVIRTNGVIDIGATLLTARSDQAYGLPYGTWLAAPLSLVKPSHISGRINDNNIESIRVELFRLAQADNKPNVILRFFQAGTASWWWGIDEVGLYEVNTPVVTTPPVSKRINATESAVFTVVGTSPTTITYQWQHAGTNISNGGHFAGVDTPTLTVSNATTNEAGAYRCVLSNSSGPTTSAPGTLTVVDIPVVDVQPVPVLVSKGFPASFSVTAAGRPPLSYQWQHDGTNVPGGTAKSLAIPSVQNTDAGPYKVIVSATSGSTTSSVASMIVIDSALTPITSQLMVHLKFDGNYADSSGRGNNAAQVGSPGFAAGKIGQGFQYTVSAGAGSYATLNYPPDLHFTTSTDFSVAYWAKINPGSKAGDPPMISNKNWDSGSNIGWVCGVQGNGNFEWNYREECPNTRKDFDSSVKMDDGQWHHIVWSNQRGGLSRTTIDGVLVNVQSIINQGNPATTIDTDPAIADNQNCSGNGTRNANAVNIGQDGRGIYNISVTNAVIDDVGIWRRALTPEEANAIYKAGNAGMDLQQAFAATLGVLHVQLVGNNVQFSWIGGTGIRLQRSNPLGQGWADVGGTLGLSSYSESASTAQQSYFRLYKP